MSDRLITVLGSVLLIALCDARQASAQVDLSGIWAPIMHEDSVERAAGPDIGDYLGLPINDAGASPRRGVGRRAS